MRDLQTPDESLAAVQDLLFAVKGREEFRKRSNGECWNSFLTHAVTTVPKYAQLRTGSASDFRERLQAFFMTSREDFARDSILYQSTFYLGSDRFEATTSGTSGVPLTIY